MNLALLGVRRRLRPNSGLAVELLPCREHCLGRPAAGEHDQSHAIRRCLRLGSTWLSCVIAKFGESFTDGAEFCLAEKSLPGGFAVLLNPLAGVACHGITPGLVLARLWLECE